MRVHGGLRVVVGGGGVAGLEALVALRTLAGSAVELHLVCPQTTFTVRALGVYERFGIGAPQVYGVAEIAADLDAVLHRDAVHRVRAAAGRVALQSGEELAYDALVLAVGAFAHPAFAHGVCFGGSREPLDEVVADLRARPEARLAGVVPTGVGWTLPAYEIALAAAADAPGTRVTLVTHEPEPLAAFGPPAAAMVREELAVAGVELVCGADAEVPGSGTVQLGEGEPLEVDHVVHLPLLTGPRLRGLACDDDGFILVDSVFRARGWDDVYAVGDAISGDLKQGGLAAEQAGVVAARRAARAGVDRRPEPFVPVLRGLLRTARGPRYLRAAAGTCLVSEQPLWWPPGKVASRWLVPWLATRDLERRPAPAAG
ncbi:MAG: FAD-dependent oxidoreductase [Solirubrobacteraceae bacterium]